MLFATPQSTWYWQRAISLESCLKIGHLEAVWDLVWANAHIPSQRYKPAKSGMHELIDSIGSMKIDQFSTHISNLLLLDLTGWTASILQQQVALKEKLTKKNRPPISAHKTAASLFNHSRRRLCAVCPECRQGRSAARRHFYQGDGRERRPNYR